MAASNSADNGKKNFYSISYGYLSTKVKNLPEGVDVELTTDQLKSKMKNNENLDLRKVYVNKGGDYPHQVFFQQIEGVIQSVEKKVTDQYGTFLDITIKDIDGDTSVISVKLYGKYSENFLNRSLNLSAGKLVLRPYAVPAEFVTDDKQVIKFYNQGVVMYQNGQKIKPAYTYEELPEKDKVKDENGKDRLKNFKIVDFLVEKAFPHIDKITQESSNDFSELDKEVATMKSVEEFSNELMDLPDEDSLPF